MKRRTVVLLALVVAALGAFVWFYERRQPTMEERAAARRKLVGLDPAAVSSLALEASGQATVRLEREARSTGAQRWRMTAPESRRADAFAVDALLRSLVDLERKRTLEGAAPADLGLATPRFRVTWTTTAGSDTLIVGAPVPGSTDTLVALASQPGLGFVTAGTIAGELGKEPGAWRDRRLFPGERTAIARIRLVPPDGGPVLDLARRGEGFRLVAPVDDVPERDLVEGLLGELTTLSAQSFAAANEPFVASGGALEVTFEDATAPFRLELGPATGVGEGAPILVRAGAGGEIETARLVTRLATTLAQPLSKWRSRAWTSLASYDIEAVTVQGPGAPLELRRDGVDWRRGGQKISYPEVSDFLSAITAAGAERLDESSGTSTDPSVDESGGTSLRIELSGPKGVRESLVLRGDRATSSARPGLVLRLPAADAEQVRRTLEAVRGAKPADG